MKKHLRMSQYVSIGFEKKKENNINPFWIYKITTTIPLKTNRIQISWDMLYTQIVQEFLMWYILSVCRSISRRFSGVVHVMLSKPGKRKRPSCFCATGTESCELISAIQAMFSSQCQGLPAMLRTTSSPFLLTGEMSPSTVRLLSFSDTDLILGHWLNAFTGNSEISFPSRQTWLSFQYMYTSIHFVMFLTWFRLNIRCVSVLTCLWTSGKWDTRFPLRFKIFSLIKPMK